MTPAEALRSRAETISEAPAAQWNTKLGIDVRIVGEAQLHGINVELVRELIHRGLHSQQSRHFARTANRLARREIFQHIPLQSKGSFAQIEMLAKANHLTCLIADEPVTWTPPLLPVTDAMSFLAMQAPAGVGRVAGREEDDHLLAAPADRGTADRDRLNRSVLLDPGRIARRRVAAVEPEVVEVPIDAGETDAERGRGGRECGGPAHGASPAGGPRAG